MTDRIEQKPVRDRLLAEGFDAVGFTKPGQISAAGRRLEEFLERDWQGDMQWMVSKADRRANPFVLWPDVRSIIVVGMNYAPSSDPLSILNKSDCGGISVYAQGRDYHDVIKKRLKKAAHWIQDRYGGDLKVFVDTAPIMEKPLAEAAGLGWQGKHTNLVSSDFGSWLFLASIFTTLDFAEDKAHVDQCGTCSSCIDICPTNAIPAPYQLDARRCISYLTIEHKGHIAKSFRAAIGNRIYGCDDCLAVCPWNKFAAQAREQAFHPRSELQAPLLKELAALDDGGFRDLFTASPIKRLGRDRFVRNVLIAIGNSHRRDLLESAVRLLRDPSPLVRAMAIWAVREIAAWDEFKRLRPTHMAQETDTAVIAEWNDADA